MTTLEFQGKLAAIGEEQTINEKMKKLSFLIEEEKSSKDGEKKWTDSASFELLNDKIGLIKDYKVGDELKVSFNIKCNEHKGKYYNSLNAWKIEKA